MTISAKIIADSISTKGHRITTFELEYPRMIHAELMTHRLFSRNAASSRAIPVAKAIRLILELMAMPSHWGKNQPGMSAKEENTQLVESGMLDKNGQMILITREAAWARAADDAVTWGTRFSAAGYHKQIVNRLMEPFSHIKAVLTSTDYANWYNLRSHEDAQPEIKILSDLMNKAADESVAVVLGEGDWHVPYFGSGQWIRDKNKSKVMVPPSVRPIPVSMSSEEFNSDGIPLSDAISVSASCCAQVSYRVLNDSIDKARELYQRLITSKPAHASPMEHQATPITHDAPWYSGRLYSWAGAAGITGVRFVKRNDDGDDGGKVDQVPVSGNFSNWIQNRQLIENHDCW